MPPTRITGKTIRDMSLTDADVAAANVDGLPGVPSLRTLGTGPQQAAAGDDPRLALNDAQFKQSQAASTLTSRYYPCGLLPAAGGTSNNNSATGRVTYLPLRSGTGLTLRAVGLFNNNAPGATTFNMGLYTSRGPQDLHPDLLVAQTGVFNLNAFPVPFTLSGLSIPLVPNQVYWLAVAFWNNGPNVKALQLGVAEPILGYNATFTQGSPGWQQLGVPQGLFTSPAPAATPITANDAPLVFYGV